MGGSNTTVGSGPGTATKQTAGQCDQSGVTKSNTISAQATITTTGADIVSIYWNTSAGTATTAFRTLTTIKI